MKLSQSGLHNQGLDDFQNSPFDSSNYYEEQQYESDFSHLRSKKPYCLISNHPPAVKYWCSALVTTAESTQP